MKNAIIQRRKKKTKRNWPCCEDRFSRTASNLDIIPILFIWLLRVVRPHFLVLGLETLWTNGFAYKYLSFSLGFSQYVRASLLVLTSFHHWFTFTCLLGGQRVFFFFLNKESKLITFCFSILHLPFGNYTSFCISQEGLNDSEFKMYKMPQAS